MCICCPRSWFPSPYGRWSADFWLSSSGSSILRPQTSLLDLYFQMTALTVFFLLRFGAIGDLDLLSSLSADLNIFSAEIGMERI